MPLGTERIREETRKIGVIVDDEQPCHGSPSRREATREATNEELWVGKPASASAAWVYATRVMGWAQPAMLLLAAAGALRVETTTPDALCPELGEVRRAVEARLGDIEGAGPWLASYALVHRPDADAADVVRLELRDPSGRLRLRRDLPRAGASCRAVAQAMVVVLDSYFRRPTDTMDAPDGASGDAGAPARPPVVVATRAAVGPAPPAPLEAGLDLVGGWAGAPSSPALAVEAWLAGRSGWAARLQGAWLAAAPTQQIPAGATSASATLRGGAIRAGVAARARPGTAVELVLGPEAVLVLERAGTSGLADQAANTRAAWGIGMSAEARVRVAPRVAISVLAACDYTPPAWGGSFAVENFAGEIFRPPRLRLLVGAGVSFALFR